LQRGEKVLLENLNLSVRRGERVALVGANGSGKSTLLETVLGRLGTHAGEVVYGHGLEVYWSGQHGEELDAFETLQDALLAAQKELRLQDIYILLANLGLPKDPLHLLSGGEGTRLSLARLSVTRAHLLVLDEPTNHLDIHAIEALEDLLVNYPGTVLFASHDRRLVARVATRRLHLGTADPAGTG
jgi:ATP-binding cassette subfamily F protein 3